MRYRANNRYNTTLTAAFDGATDVTMKVKTLPEFLPTILTLNYGTSTESTWQVTGYSGTDTLIGLTLIRGTATTYYEGTPVDCLNWADFYNQYFDVSTFFFAEDQTDYSPPWDNQYDLLISDTNFDLARGTLLAFEPIQTNTGAVTIKINDLEPQTLTKNGGEALIAGDMIAGQIMTMMYDGDDLQLLSVAAEDATSSSKGIVKPDNSTTFVTSGVISTLPDGYKTITIADAAGTADASEGRWWSGTLTDATTTITIANLDMGVLMMHLKNNKEGGITGITFLDDSSSAVTIVPVGDLNLADDGVTDIIFQSTPSGIIANVRQKTYVDSTPQTVTITSNAGTIITRVGNYHYLNFTASVSAATTITSTMSDGDACTITVTNSDTSAVAITFTGVTEDDFSTAFAPEVPASGSAIFVVQRIGTNYVGFE